MYRSTFDALFLEYYEKLVEFATKRVGTDGPDCVHQAYANIIEHETYKAQNRPQYRVLWLYFKVRREIALYKAKEQTRRRKEIESYDL